MSKDLKVFLLEIWVIILKCIHYFDRALEIDPNYESALNNKGVALLNLHNYTEALDYFDRVLEIDPNFKQALNNKGLSLSELGNHSGSSMDYFDRALEIDPNFKQALNNKRAVFLTV